MGGQLNQAPTGCKIVIKYPSQIIPLLSEISPQKYHEENTEVRNLIALDAFNETGSIIK